MARKEIEWEEKTDTYKERYLLCDQVFQKTMSQGVWYARGIAS